VKRLVILLMTLAFIALTAGTVFPETYVEGYIGNNFTVSSPNPIGFDVNPAYRGPTRADPEYPRHFSSAIIGGGKLGTWFSKEGFPGFNYPDWMKYLGFYLDFNYHWIDYKPGVGSRRMYITPSTSPFYQHYKFSGTGSLTTFAFMLAFRYGFLPTEKVPFGKLQPYVGLGPAVVITGFKPIIMFQPGYFDFVPGSPGYRIPGKFTGSFQSTVNVGLSVEAGIRWMITRFLSLDTSIKYRYVRPSTSYDISIYGFTHELRLAPQLNLFSIQTGVAYHF